jgi:ATP-dependent exoDNAse (exonuclease V) beta subunit
MMQHSFMNAFRQPFAMWVKNAWLLLGGPACVTQDADLVNAQQYFNLLASLAKSGHLDLKELEANLQRLYATSNAPHARVQLMTIHKAKGLEFDTVILPSLEANARSDHDKILLWHEIPTEHDAHELLLAPIKPKGAKEDDPTYCFLKGLEKEKQLYENARLFYVAVTRARAELYLLAQLPKEDKQPIEKSFLTYVWQDHQTDFVVVPRRITIVDTLIKPGLTRLCQSYQVPNLVEFIKTADIDSVPTTQLPRWQSPSARLFGNSIHILCKVLSEIPQIEWSIILGNPQLVRTLFLQQKLHPEEIPNAMQRVSTFTHQIQQSIIAPWVLSCHHQDAASELALSLSIGGDINNIIIDRTFVENNIRWIIDYKTSEPGLNQDEASFLQTEKQRYQTQLEIYALAFKPAGLAIKLALYFPMIDKLLTWTFN